mmetsp:Transcript_5124/g.14634  ORF Transcript_5124/g.14634 Transcript_5124/m.14634 type:complete len:295 (+) Transcript_5124:241-1125(+)
MTEEGSTTIRAPQALVKDGPKGTHEARGLEVCSKPIPSPIGTPTPMPPEWPSMEADRTKARRSAQAARRSARVPSARTTAIARSEAARPARRRNGWRQLPARHHGLQRLPRPVAKSAPSLLTMRQSALPERHRHNEHRCCGRSCREQSLGCAARRPPARPPNAPACSSSSLAAPKMPEACRAPPPPALGRHQRTPAPWAPTPARRSGRTTARHATMSFRRPPEGTARRSRALAHATSEPRRRRRPRRREEPAGGNAKPARPEALRRHRHGGHCATLTPRRSIRRRNSRTAASTV